MQLGRDCGFIPALYRCCGRQLGGRCLTVSKRLEQLFVLRMRADPEPNQRIGFKHSDSPPVQIHPSRIDGKAWMNLLEPQRRMGWILRPLTVCGLDAGLTRRRCRSEQRPEPLGRYGNHRSSRALVRPARNSANASEARASRMCSDAANDWDQRCSEEISSSRIAARMSCSSGGSFVATATADARACVMFGTS